MLKKGGFAKPTTGFQNLDITSVGENAKLENGKA